MTYERFWQNIAEKILPQGRKQKELREKIKAKSDELTEFKFKNMSIAKKMILLKKLA